jgi:excinuclease UvrABC nuclease subunit
MLKNKINITLDQDLIDFAKSYAEYQRTSVSEIFSQFLLSLKRTKENDPTEIIMADPDFRESLIQTLSRIRSGKVKWHTYDEVF